jgi:hypothetical protein
LQGGYFYKVMPQKLIHVLISLLLIISTTGLSIDKHYCGDNLVSYNLFGKAKSCTGMDEGCCHQETDTYKLTVDYTAPVFNMTFEQDYHVIPLPATVYALTLRDGFHIPDQYGPGPPPIPHTTLTSLQAYRL